MLPVTGTALNEIKGFEMKVKGAQSVVIKRLRVLRRDRPGKGRFWVE